RKADHTIVRGIGGEVAAVIGTREDAAVAGDGDEIAEKFEFSAARLDLGDRAAEMEHVAEKEGDGHAVGGIEARARADQRRDAERQAGFIHAAIGPDRAGKRKAQEAQSLPRLDLRDGVEKTRIVEGAAGEKFSVDARQRETRARAGMVDLVLPRAET